ncbi:putative beta-lysine N-acetyltransferase [Peribacillus sp. SCS-155]|uniref:putative beta-lysine N-acetyltransferase n=1 Tax=Peribacillus sedimenti TaxID=3115297 RepID=UPI0039069AB1
MEQIKNIQVKEPGFSLALTIDAFNKRVRLDDYHGTFEFIVNYCVQIAEEHKAEKLIVKARREQVDDLIRRGFVLEGEIQHYFYGSSCYFFARYFVDERRNSTNWAMEDEILDRVLALKKHVDLSKVPAQYTKRKAEEEDAGKLASLYRRVFQVYPVPMDDPHYVTKCMKQGSVFYVYECQGSVISAASAEINSSYHNAEITDCATLPEHRQFGLMKHLISELEKHLYQQEIYCLYSIARSLSFGMNAAFHQLGYEYSGRLANNCFIFDKLEDMNVWVKHNI